MWLIQLAAKGIELILFVAGIVRGDRGRMIADRTSLTSDSISTNIPAGTYSAVAREQIDFGTHGSLEGASCSCGGCCCRALGVRR